MKKVRLYHDDPIEETTASGAETTQEVVAEATTETVGDEGQE